MKQSAKWIIIGSICIAISQILSGLNEVVVKASNLTITQLLMCRFFIQFIIASLWWKIKKPTNPLIFNSTPITNDINNSTTVKNWYGDSPYILNIWLRGFIFSMSGGILFWYSVDRLPLGDLQCIMYQSPLFVVYISAIWLKERLPNLYILIPSTILTITGIICVSQPSFLMVMIDTNYQYETLNIDGMIAITFAAFGWAFSVLLVRTAIDTHFLQLEFASSGCSVMITVPVTIMINRYLIHSDVLGDCGMWTFDIYALPIILFLGVSGFAVLSLSIIGYQCGSATMVSWLEYITIPIGFIYQICIFNDLPNKYEIIGAILVTIGCLLPVMHQIFIYYFQQTHSQFNMLHNIVTSDEDTTDQQGNDNEISTDIDDENVPFK
eukprot:55422_1